MDISLQFLSKKTVCLHKSTSVLPTLTLESLFDPNIPQSRGCCDSAKTTHVDNVIEMAVGICSEKSFVGSLKRRPN